MQLTHKLTVAAAHGGLRASLSGPAKLSVSLLDYLTPPLDLGIRLLIASVLFQSGLTKIASWDSTLLLFQSEYPVPLLLVRLLHGPGRFSLDYLRSRRSMRQDGAAGDPADLAKSRRSGELA